MAADSQIIGQDLQRYDFEDRLVGIVSTRYEDPADLRYSLALQTAQAYHDADVPLVVMDSSPESWAADSLSERGAIVVSAPRPGLATQYIDGVTYALGQGAAKLLKQEPEKVAMVQFADEISDALNAHDIVVIGRTERAMDSLPPVQERTERMAGWLLEQHLNFPPDALSGGRGYTRRGAAYLQQYDVEQHGNNWLYLYHPELQAMAEGVSVGGIALDLLHPPEMTAAETGSPEFDAKRYGQFFLQLDNLLQLRGYRPRQS